MKFKENLIELRKLNNISQSKLAKYLNVSRPCISDWERGKSEPSLFIIEKIKKYFDVTYDELLED